MAEARRRADRSQRCQFPVCLVECEQIVEVDVRQSVAPGEHETLVTHTGLQALDPPAGLRFDPGVHQIDGPVQVMFPPAFDHTGFGADGQVAIERAIVGHVLLDVFALVAERDTEILIPELRGLPPISTIGFGLLSVSSDNREPTPPAKSATFMPTPFLHSVNWI